MTDIKNTYFGQHFFYVFSATIIIAYLFTFGLTFAITWTPSISFQSPAEETKGYVRDNVILSWELRDALGMSHAPSGLCDLSPEYKAVLAWLRHHESEIINAEKTWNVSSFLSYITAALFTY